MDLLVELVLLRRPLSLQTKNRVAPKKYQDEVRAAATLKLVRVATPGEDVFFSIGDFSWTGNQADADNIIKPAQDALAPLVYGNDDQVRDSLGFTRDTLGLVPVGPGTLPDLLAGLAWGGEFMHVAVSAASDPHFDGVIDV